VKITYQPLSDLCQGYVHTYVRLPRLYPENAICFSRGAGSGST